MGANISLEQHYLVAASANQNGSKNPGFNNKFAPNLSTAIL